MRLARTTLAAGALVLCATCMTGKDPKLKEAFRENFDSGWLDPNIWRITRPTAYQVKDGALVAEGAKNSPMWLKLRIPCDVKIEFTARSEANDGDLKVEVFGDGRSSADHEGAYTGTGYVVIFGGWRNTVNTIARKDEHGARLFEENETKVEKGRTYRFSLQIRGGRIEWFLDGRLFMRVDDPEPLCAAGNDHFAFSNWATQVHFDDLAITPL